MTTCTSPSSKSSTAIDPAEVARAHDDMAGEYDQLEDLWYPWLFAQIHELIGRNLAHARGVDGAAERRPRALDVGCGTGFQSYLLARAGYDVLGFDIADGLLDVARRKAAQHALPPLAAPSLFEIEPRPAWADEHEKRLAACLEAARSGRDVRAPEFAHGDVTTFDFGNGGWDVITCCGSVVSFVDSYAAAIGRMAAGLRSAGRLFLEVEQRVSADLLWPAIDRVVRGRLGYGQTWSEIGRNLVARPGQSVRVDYPFDLKNGQEVTLPIWLFSIAELERLFSKTGLRIVERAGVHQITNLLPSTLLHQATPAPATAWLFELLRRADGKLARRWPFWRLGCSVVYCLERSATA